MLLSPSSVGRRAQAVADSLTHATEEIVLRALERGLDVALRGPLVDAFARNLVRYRVIQRIADPLVEADAIEDVGRPLVEHMMDSDFVDEVVERLLESEQLWVLVDEIASSPAVTDAISHQGVGFADQMAGAVRDRSRHADARLERVARRMLGRGARRADNGAVPEREP